MSTGSDANASNRKENTLTAFFESVDFSEYWSYPGSFTTPPCTEGVRWSVVKDVQPISSTQLNEFTKYWAGNLSFAGGKGSNRATQPIHDRTLYLSDDLLLRGVNDGATSVTAFGAAVVAAIAALAF